MKGSGYLHQLIATTAKEWRLPASSRSRSPDNTLSSNFPIQIAPEGYTSFLPLLPGDPFRVSSCVEKGARSSSGGSRPLGVTGRLRLDVYCHDHILTPLSLSLKTCSNRAHFFAVMVHRYVLLLIS